MLSLCFSCVLSSSLLWFLSLSRIFCFPFLRCVGGVTFQRKQVLRSVSHVFSCGGSRSLSCVLFSRCQQCSHLPSFLPSFYENQYGSSPIVSSRQNTVEKRGRCYRNKAPRMSVSFCFAPNTTLRDTSSNPFFLGGWTDERIWICSANFRLYQVRAGRNVSVWNPPSSVPPRWALFEDDVLIF